MSETTSKIMSACASRIARVFKHALMNWGASLSPRPDPALALIFIFSAGSLCLALYLSHAPHNPAGTFHLFGPMNYERERGRPIPVTSNFNVLRPGPDYLLRIFNGGRDRQFRTTGRAAVWLNGVKVASPRDFNLKCGDREDDDERDDEQEDNDTRHHVRVIEKRVTLAAGNTLTIKLRGARGSGLTLEVVGVDRELPTITATSAPPPNAAGWNNTDVNVSFTCADQTSGIASCPPPVTVTTEGVNQIVTGTATDRAGHTASAAATLNIDKTPPALQITSPADGTTTSAPAINITGSITDALSGLVAVDCNGAAATPNGGSFSCDVPLVEGTNAIMLRAVDVAGNEASSNLSITYNPAPTVVPDVTSHTHRAARTALHEVHLAVGTIGTAHSNSVAAGRVLSQTPAAGAQAPAGSAVNLVLSLGRAGATPPISFTLDPSVTPAHAEIAPLGDGAARRVASIVDERGHQADFVENELLLTTNDAEAVTAFVARWQGQILRTIDPSQTRLTGLSRIYHLRINASLADPAAMVADLRAVTAIGRGTHRVTNETGLRLLAAAQMEHAGGLLVTPNWIFESHDIPNRSTAEDASSSFMGPNGISYGNDAFNWPYMNRGSRQDIGVGEAWRALSATGRIHNRVSVMVYDSGFDTTNLDFSPNLTLLGQIDRAGPATCGGGTPCPWHGTSVVEAGMGLPDNSFGVAGPGGPVSDLILVGSPSFDLSELADYLIDVPRSTFTGPDIINMSFGFRLPAALSIGSDQLLGLIAEAFRLGGTLIIASAGNQGQDVDAQDCVSLLVGDVCWEEAAWLPCETSGVMCVGGLAWDSTARASGNTNSNFGSQPNDCCTVDIFGPHTLFLLTDATVDPLTRRIAPRNGTSYAAPFVAGVAALVWAADPNLSDGDVEDILINTAHTNSGDSTVPRWVNAYAAVLEALPNHPPSINISTNEPRVPCEPNQPVDPAQLCLSRRRDITLRANVRDREDGGNVSVRWVSDRRGLLGSGTSITVSDLDFGSHLFTATATDTNGFTNYDALAFRLVNDQPPTIEITAPADRAVFRQGQDIMLSGASADLNNPPTHTLSDAEVVWRLDDRSAHFAQGHNATLPGSAQTPGVHLLTLTGIDSAGGVNPPHTASDFISITIEPDGLLPGLPPSVSINSPADGDRFVPAHLGNGQFAADVMLSGAATDPEDGVLSGARLVWTDRVNGGAERTLGVGATINARLFTAGLTGETIHDLTLYATDQVGHVGSATIRVIVVLPDVDGDGLSFGQESVLGTNPGTPDTDADGVWDGAEIFLATDPNSNASRPTDIPPGTLFASTSGIFHGPALTLIDPDTGNFGVLGRPPGVFGGFGLAFNGAGTLYISTGARLHTFEPLSGAATEVGQYLTPAGTALSVLQIAYNPADGMLYGIEEGPPPNFLSTGQLVRINPSTAQAERVGDGSLNPRINALACTPGGTLYGIAEGVTAQDSNILIEIAPGSGLSARQVGPIGSAHVFGLAFDRAGRLLAGRFVADDEGQLLNVSPADGAGAHLSTVGRPVFGMTVKPCPAPCFSPPVNVPVSGFLSYIEAADFNLDGKLDVAASAASPERVVVLYGNGNGTFQPPLDVLLPANSNPFALAVADLNGDGRLDIVTGNRATQSLSVLLNDGAGGFHPPSEFSVGGAAFTLNSIAAADMTGDGRTDIIASVGRTLALLVGDGTGSFGAPLLHGASQFTIRSLAIGNLDGDVDTFGRPILDVVVANTAGGVVVLFGDGAGNFPRSAGYLVVFSASYLALDDLNGDGRPDLAVPDVESQRVFVVLNDGAGNLLPGTGYLVGPAGVAQRPIVARIGDLTGEGHADVVTANTLTNSASVLPGNGQGLFGLSLRSPFPVGGAPQYLALGDFNGDGRLDLVTANGTGGLSVLLNSAPF